jgi:hypothetical protein
MFNFIMISIHMQSTNSPEKFGACHHLVIQEPVRYRCFTLQNGCDYIVTRNCDDYKNSKIRVCTPDEFMCLYAG